MRRIVMLWFPLCRRYCGPGVARGAAAALRVFSSGPAKACVLDVGSSFVSCPLSAPVGYWNHTVGICIILTIRVLVGALRQVSVCFVLWRQANVVIASPFLVDVSGEGSTINTNNSDF